MKTKLTCLTVLLLIGVSLNGLAADALSDGAIKEKILGYWGNARHSYLIKSDGMMYMCPRDISTTTNRWDVKDGMFYLDGDAHKIVSLTDQQFVYRSTGTKPFTVTWKRLTEQQAEGR
jgi:hypothetical protein